MIILKRYKILFLVIIAVILFFHFYNIYLMNRAIDYMVTEILKSGEHGKYIWDIKK